VSTATIANMSGLSQKEQDIHMMLAAQCHLGTKNCDFQMERYVYKRRNDGIYVLDLAKTWDKLALAARVIVSIENPADIVVQSARPYGQRAVMKFAQYTGSTAIAGRHTPGTYTNHIHGKTFREPRMLLLTDPRTDHQPIRESAYQNLPTIAFCDTDSPMGHVDVAIPANNKGKHSIGCLYFILSRMVLTMRGTISMANPWDVMVDLFFYRDPEEIREEQEASAAAAIEDTPGYNAASYGAAPAIAGGFEQPAFEEAGAPPAFEAQAQGQMGGFAAASAPADFMAAAPPQSAFDPASQYTGSY